MNIIQSTQCTQFPTDLPNDLNRLMVRMAFSTLNKVQDPNEGFMDVVNEKYTAEEMYNNIQVLEQFSVVVNDPILAKNHSALKPQLLEKLKHDFSNAPKMDITFGLFQPISDYKEGKITLEEALKALSSAEINTTDGTKRAPAIYQIDPASAKFLVKFADKNWILHKMLAIINPWCSERSENATRVARFALEGGAQPNAQHPQNKTAPMHLSCTKEFTELLVEFGGDIELRDNEGNTPLHYAVQYAGGELIASFLLSKNANKDARNNNGETPIFSALKRRGWEQAKVLTDAGADLKVVTRNGKPLIDYAMEMYKPLDILPLHKETAVKVMCVIIFTNSHRNFEMIIQADRMLFQEINSCIPPIKKEPADNCGDVILPKHEVVPVRTISQRQMRLIALAALVVVIAALIFRNLDIRPMN